MAPFYDALAIAVCTQYPAGRDALSALVCRLQGRLADTEQIRITACGEDLVYLRVLDNALPDPVCNRLLLTFDVAHGEIRPRTSRKPQYSYSRFGWHELGELLMGEPMLQFSDAIHPYQRPNGYAPTRVATNSDIFSSDGG